MRGVRVPSALQTGARIAVIAPGSVVDRTAVERGMETLESWGYRPVAGQNLFKRQGDLAGSDEARARDLIWAFESSEIDAVWAARGGWGTARLFDRLPRTFAKRANRWLFGFSDITSLQLLLLNEGLVSWQSALVTELGTTNRFVRSDLLRALRDPFQTIEHRMSQSARLRSGRARGRLSGGCLTLVASLAGTRWEPKMDGSILFLEEVGEPPYRIDRLMWQLRESGLTRRITGLVYGQFVHCKPRPGKASRSLTSVLRDHADAIGVPTMIGFPSGHGRRSRPLPLGYDTVLDVSRGILRLKAPDVRQR